jgi:anthranilate synthase component II
MVSPPGLNARRSNEETNMITIIDNYDSFTYNLVQQIERLAGERLRVIRNDDFDPDALLAQKPRALVISPGPGTPSRAGRCIDLVHALARANDAIPLLGVCLGHQAIAEAFGARVVRGEMPVHGKVTGVHHRGERLFAGCPEPMQSARYHSLVVDPSTLSEEFAIDAESDDGAIMAISHRARPLFGIQFHPESYGTPGGDQVIRNFLDACHPELVEGSPPEGDPSPSSRLRMTRGEVQ